MGDLKCLTTKEVARLCRVSDATVKRWQAAGLLHSERTNGGHRRFRAEEVARFQREQSLGEKRCVGDESVLSALSGQQRRAPKTDSDSTFFQALLKGCEEAAANVIINEYLKGAHPAKICDEIICPAMFQIGELWAAGKINITHEHLATRVALNAIYKLRQSLLVSETAGKSAMCCAPSGDFHELPTHLAQMIIENAGWEAVNFGANTPLEDFASEVARHAPALVCISLTILTDAETLARDYKRLRERCAKLEIPVLIGGGAFRDDAARRHFPAEFYAHSFGEFVELLGTPSSRVAASAGIGRENNSLNIK